MRRLAVFFLAAAITVGLLGCVSGETEKTNVVSFYYLRSDVVFSSEDGVITRELRNVEELETDTFALLEAYMEGPLAKELVNAFPVGCELVTFQVEEGIAEVCLSEEVGTLEGMELTVACACLAKTVMGMTGVRVVRIRGENILLAGNRYVEMHADKMMYTDNSAVATETTRP